ncbi:MAG TPA: FimV/HubP family polar landmark protein [Burkholderiaceae bacterium]|nr:FimV/HubP family polar landmark protein [Burkholderiaceae bacterium]
MAPAQPPKAESAPVEPPKAAAPSDAAPPTPAASTAPAPVAEASMFDDLLENPFLLPGLGGIALLGAGYGWYAMRRRRKVEKFEDSLIAADAFTANSLFGSTGGQSVDTSNSVFATPAASAVDVHATEVDPIAEADVYIAYGRESQAEDILKEALKRQPERQAIRAKLLEIHSGRKDAKAFEAVAREMHEMTGGQNEEWPKVVTMGLSLDPENPLYGGGVGSAAPGLGAAGAAGAVAAGAAFAASGHDLDFPDMNLEAGAPELPSLDLPAASAPAVPSPAPSASAESYDDMPSLDFDLDLDTRIDRAASVEGAEIADTLAGGAAGDDAAAKFDLPSLDLDLDAAPAAAAPMSHREEPVSELDLDLPSLEGLGAPTPLSGGPIPANAPGLDLSPISLDLEPATALADDESEAALGASGRWQEMATKLDLASAYEEIGDKEGARELLQEVIRGGDGGQQQKARAMLAKIG